MPTIALIAHGDKKDDIVAFCRRRRDVLGRLNLVATGTTGKQIADLVGLPVQRMLSGPLGGDAQIAAMVATEQIAGVIFLVDPLHAHPHEPDIQGLHRVCNVHNIPLATNLATAEILVEALAARATDPPDRD